MSLNAQMPAAHIAISCIGDVATVELVNPAKKNAMTPEMWQTLQRFAGEVSGDPTVRAVLIQGRGETFSSGADIAGFVDGRDGAEGAQAYDDRLEAACAAIETIAQPTVAVLSGAVVGAGLELAASCDLRVAADDVLMMIPAARLGLGFDPRAIARLARAFGPVMAKELMLTGKPLPAERALGLGALTRCVAPERLDAAAAELVQTLVANAPLTLRAAKMALHAAGHGAPSALMAEAHRLTDAANASDDYREGRAAFAEKRPPHFRGH
ncbi:MAG: enoyl-CoA hydratase-related protein [Pseudomonadota bacterium]